MKVWIQSVNRWLLYFARSASMADSGSDSDDAIQRMLDPAYTGQAGSWATESEGSAAQLGPGGSDATGSSEAFELPQAFGTGATVQHSAASWAPPSSETGPSEMEVATEEDTGTPWESVKPRRRSKSRSRSASGADQPAEDSEPSVCPGCNVSFGDKYSFRRHYGYCQLHQVYMCPVKGCQHHSTRVSDMADHMKRRHANVLSTASVSQRAMLIERGRRTVTLTMVTPPGGGEPHPTLTFGPGLADYASHQERRRKNDAGLKSNAKKIARPLGQFDKLPPCAAQYAAEAGTCEYWPNPAYEQVRQKVEAFQKAYPLEVIEPKARRKAKAAGKPAASGLRSLSSSEERGTKRGSPSASLERVEGGSQKKAKPVTKSATCVTGRAPEGVDAATLDLAARHVRREARGATEVEDLRRAFATSMAAPGGLGWYEDLKSSLAKQDLAPAPVTTGYSQVVKSGSAKPAVKPVSKAPSDAARQAAQGPNWNEEATRAWAYAKAAGLPPGAQAKVVSRLDLCTKQGTNSAVYLLRDEYKARKWVLRGEQGAKDEPVREGATSSAGRSKAPASKTPATTQESRPTVMEVAYPPVPPPAFGVAQEAACPSQVSNRAGKPSESTGAQPKDVVAESHPATQTAPRLTVAQRLEDRSASEQAKHAAALALAGAGRGILKLRPPDTRPKPPGRGEGPSGVATSSQDERPSGPGASQSGQGQVPAPEAAPAPAGVDREQYGHAVPEFSGSSTDSGISNSWFLGRPAPAYPIGLDVQGFVRIPAGTLVSVVTQAPLEFEGLDGASLPTELILTLRHPAIISCRVDATFGRPYQRREAQVLREQLHRVAVAHCEDQAWGMPAPDLPPAPPAPLTKDPVDPEPLVMPPPGFGDLTLSDPGMVVDETPVQELAPRPLPTTETAVVVPPPPPPAATCWAAGMDQGRPTYVVSGAPSTNVTGSWEASGSAQASMPGGASLPGVVTAEVQERTESPSLLPEGPPVGPQTVDPSTVSQATGGVVQELRRQETLAATPASPRTVERQLDVVTCQAQELHLEPDAPEDYDEDALLGSDQETASE